LLPLPYPAHHVVQPPLPLHPAPDQVTQGAGRVGPAEHGVPHLVQGQPGVIGRRERIGAVAVLAVPVSHVRAPFRLPPSRCVAREARQLALRLVVPEARRVAQREGGSSTPGCRNSVAVFRDGRPFMCGRRPRRRLRPWTGGASGTGPPARTPPPPRRSPATRPRQCRAAS